MKILAFISIVLVLSTSLVPCCGPELKRDVMTAVSEGSCCSDDGCGDSKDHDESDAGCDACSPFFTCGSCSGFSFIPVLDWSPYESNLKIEFSSAYLLKLPDALSIDKWQPPKLS